MATDTAEKAKSQTVLVELTTDGIPKLHCPVCNKALISLNGYVKHVKKHEPPGGFQCRYCDARFCSDEELKRHRDQEHTTIVCRICKVTFTNENDYRDHIRVVHNGIDRELFKCEKCGAEYKTLDPYQRHIVTECGTIKPFKCNQCDIAFVTKYNLQQHIESHTGKSKYCCSFCGKNFLQKGRMIEHERSHTGEKPYKCDVCGKCFAYRESIVTHSSIHTGIRLVECRCCNSRFSCYSNLIKHRRTRPDTCGQSIYDPPKNRKRRKFLSRIPATLNPTSEIKVNGPNKIIKPDDQQKDKISNSNKKRKKKSLQPEDPQSRTSKKSLQTDHDDCSEDDAYEVESDEQGNYNITITNKNKRKDRNIPTAKSENGDNFSTNTYNESNNSFSGDEYEFMNNNAVMTMIPTTNIKEEHLEIELQNVHDDDSHEFGTYFNNNTSSSISHIEVKPDTNHLNGDDDENDLYDDCGIVLTDLINSDQDVESDTAAQYSDNVVGIVNKTEKSSSKPKVKLEQTEVILVDDCVGEYFEGLEEEENVLEGIESPKKCRIMLDDITKRYPQLKDQTKMKLDQLKTRERMGKKIKRIQNHTNKLAAASEKRNEDGIPEEPALKMKKRKTLTTLELKERLKQVHNEPTTWQCPHCVRVYHMRKPFEKHLRKQHQTGNDELKEIFKSELETVVDAAVKRNEAFKCPICDKIYLMKKRLQDHLIRHGPLGNLIVKCPCYCSKFFETKEDAIAHAQKEHRDKLYCQLCDKFCNGHDSLRNHIKTIHAKNKTMLPLPKLNKRNFVCDKCGKKFPGRTSLTDHVRSDCGRNPIYKCNVCGKQLTTAGILKTHLLLHSDDTPYQCDICGKAFKVKAQYRTHIKTRHTNNKPFKCHLCPKAYPYRESLLTHMTVHTGIKRFLCSGCGKRFTCVSNLQAHRKVHADTCGQLPLNAKATQYMGVQKGHLLLGAKPEAGIDFNETNTLVASEIIDRDLQNTSEINFPSAEHSECLPTEPLKYPIDSLDEQLAFHNDVDDLTAVTDTEEMLQLPHMLSQLIEADQNNFS